VRSRQRAGRTNAFRRGGHDGRAAEAARAAAHLTAAARALALAGDQLEQADKRVAERDALLFAAETLETAAYDCNQLRQQAEHQARTLRLEAEHDAVQLRLVAQREAAELRAAAAVEVEQLRREVAQETRKMRIQAKALAETRRTGAQMHLQVEEHAARVRAEADELMRRATAAARRSTTAGAPRPAAVTVPAHVPSARARADGRVRARRARVGVVVAGLLTVGGAGLVTAAGPSQQVSRLAGVTQAAVGWSPQQFDVATLQSRLATAPDRQGPSGRALVGALSQLEQLDDAERRNRALGLARDIETAVRNGLLDPEAERLVRPVLLREMTPPDVSGLIAMLEVAPLGAGPAGDAFLETLRALPEKPTADERRAALQEVRDLADAGQLNSAFRYVADQVLR